MGSSLLAWVPSALSPIWSTRTRFVADTKLSGEVNTSAGRDIFQRKMDRLEECPTKNCVEFNNDKCRVLHLVHHNQYRLGSVWLGSTLLIATWVSWWTTNWTRVSSALLQQWRQNSSWAASAAALLAQIEMWSSHSIQSLSSCTWNTVSSSSPHNSRKKKTGRSRSKRGTGRWPKGCRTCPMEERLKELNFFSLEKRSLGGTSLQYSST